MLPISPAVSGRADGTNYFLAKRPTRYFFCQAGEPNFILRPPPRFLVDERAAAFLPPLRRRRLPPPFDRRPGGNNAAREAGVICEKPAIPPGGTANEGIRPHGS